MDDQIPENKYRSGLGPPTDSWSVWLNLAATKKDEFIQAGYVALLEQLPAIVYTAALDEASTTLYVSPQVLPLLGYSPAEYRDDPDIWRKRLHADDYDRVMAEVARSHEKGGPFSAEYRMITRDNRVVWFHDHAVIVHDSQGQPLFLQGLMWDITERVLAEEALRQARQELEAQVTDRTRALAEANRDLRNEIIERAEAELALQKSSEDLKMFTYSIVHDLKSPTTAIYGLTRNLKKHYQHLLDDRGLTYCDQIVRAAELVAVLVEKINTFITAKEAPLHVEKVNVGEILQIVWEEFALRIKSRRINWLAPAEPMEIRADRLALLRVFRNLVDNALKYGGDLLTEIRVGYEQASRTHIFSVADNGNGLRAEDMDRIFGLFQRPQTGGVPGTGLGLAIVRELANRHGGDIWVTRGPGRRTTFFISFPKDIRPGGGPAASGQTD